MDDREWFIDRYEVLRTVSEGHRATVMQALDHLHGRFVALKVYPLRGEDRDSLLAEARVLISMAPHPALPVVRGDFFTADGDKFVLVMNWIEGHDLQEVLDDEGNPGIPIQDVIEDLTSVADALDHLHAHNPPIVHGDVKPANLVRSDDGRVVLVDFDIAVTTTTYGTAGTSGFIAPEVAAGDKPGPAADIYGLAATVVTLLTGSPPRSTTQMPGGASAADISRILHNALRTDPAKRPTSARRLIENLRRLSNAPPAAVVAMLAVEVDDTSRMWLEHGGEIHVAARRLRDARDEVLDARGGSVVATLDEGDKWIALFSDPSSAALAALDLHDRARTLTPSRGIDIHLRAAIVAGQVEAAEGAFRSSLIDQAARVRGLAKPGTTLASEAAADLLVDMVGHGITLVPLAAAPGAGSVAGSRLFTLAPEKAAVWPPAALADPGAEPTTRLEVSRSAAAGRALAAGSTLTFITIAAFGVIFQLVLSSVLEIEWPGRVAAFVGIVGAIISFRRSYSRDLRAQKEQLRTQLQDEEDARTRREEAAERLRIRQRLLQGFDRLRSDEASEAAHALRGLALEFDSTTDLLERSRKDSSSILPSLLPGLIEDAYRIGVSALSDALLRFESTEGPNVERLRNQLAEREERLDRNAYADERVRRRDEDGRKSDVRLLALHDEMRQGGCDLVSEAERCTTALTEARIELASARPGDTHVDVDAVVQTLEHTIQRVRDVQNELRRLGHQ